MFHIYNNSLFCFYQRQREMISKQACESLECWYEKLKPKNMKSTKRCEDRNSVRSSQVFPPLKAEDKKQSEI